MLLNQSFPYVFLVFHCFHWEFTVTVSSMRENIWNATHEVIKSVLRSTQHLFVCGQLVFQDGNKLFRQHLNAALLSSLCSWWWWTDDITAAPVLIGCWEQRRLCWNSWILVSCASRRVCFPGPQHATHTLHHGNSVCVCGGAEVERRRWRSGCGELGWWVNWIPVETLALKECEPPLAELVHVKLHFLLH